MNQVVGFLGIGKLFIYFLQISPFSKKLPDGLIKELFACDLCLGFWVYLFLGVVLNKYLDEDIEKQNYVISKLATASVSTLIMHLITLGWRDKFSEYVIE